MSGTVETRRSHKRLGARHQAPSSPRACGRLPSARLQPLDAFAGRSCDTTQTDPACSTLDPANRAISEHYGRATPSPKQDQHLPEVGQFAPRGVDIVPLTTCVGAKPLNRLRDAQSVRTCCVPVKTLQGKPGAKLTSSKFAARSFTAENQYDHLSVTRYSAPPECPLRDLEDSREDEA